MNRSWKNCLYPLFYCFFLFYHEPWSMIMQSRYFIPRCFGMYLLILDIENEIDFWMILQMQRKRIFAMNFLLGVAVKIGCRPIWIFEWLIGYSLKKSFNFWSHLLEWIKKSKIYSWVKSKIICNMKFSTNSHLFWT